MTQPSSTERAPAACRSELLDILMSGGPPPGGWVEALLDRVEGTPRVERGPEAAPWRRDP